MKGLAKGMHFDRLGAGLFGGTLYRMAQKLPPTERVIKPPKKDCRNLRAKVVLSDEQVQAMRDSHERGGRSMQQVADDFGIDYGRAYKILSYEARAKPFKG